MSADATRRRLQTSLILGVGLGSTGYIAAITVATIVAKDLSGGSAFAGLPGAAIVLGSATASQLLSRFMVRHGRRAGLTLGYGVGAAGAVGAGVAVILGSFPLFLLSTVFMGCANASNQLSRYTAADMYDETKRATAIGLVVWGSTFGAVVGPNLVTIAGDAAEIFSLPRLAGTYGVPIIFVTAAALLTLVSLRPDPASLAPVTVAETPGGGASVAQIVARPRVFAAIIALVIGQVVMVLVMTMTPLHMADHGHGLDAVGLVISGHTFGMFALSPLSGRLASRFGTPLVIAVGLAVLAFSSALAAVAPPDGGVILFVALFLLGWGWNLGFVAGSALLTEGLSVSERTRLQGVTDALIWSSAAAAALGSGVVVAAASYTALGLLGAALIGLPVWAMLRGRTALRRVSPAAVSVPEVPLD
jgi:MFS family permease|uniref:MFS transporter n=1 Tax=Candidatus Limnocylindrus sp. TaxID=2802978 RepID=UPI004049E648